jgi:hypothetical protein
LFIASIQSMTAEPTLTTCSSSTMKWLEIPLSTSEMRTHWPSKYVRMTPEELGVVTKAMGVHSGVLLQHFADSHVDNQLEGPHVTEIWWLWNSSEAFDKFQELSLSPGGYLHSLSINQMSSKTLVPFNGSYFGIDADILATKPGDFVSIIRHRTSSEQKWRDFFRKYVLEGFIRNTTVLQIWGASFEDPGQGTYLTLISHHETLESAISTSKSYQKVVDVDLSKLFKPFDRLYALAPCKYSIYKISAVIHRNADGRSFVATSSAITTHGSVY